MDNLRVAVVQLCSTPDLMANLATIDRLVAKAAAGGATLVALPENATWIRVGAAEPALDPESTAGVIAHLQELARRCDCTIALGSLLICDTPGKKPTNSSLVIDRDGTVLARYDKIHLFRVDLGPETRFDETEHVEPGNNAVTARLGDTVLGLTVCYDLRFPLLFDRLALAGAEVLLVPAAFTVATGRDHWEVLLRARAIETQCYVVAAAQWGAHGAGRVSYGRSMVIDPWGTVLATVPDGDGTAVVDLSAARLAQVRASLPCRAHRVEIAAARR